MYVRIFTVCMYSRGDDPTLVPLTKSPAVWLCEGAYKYVYYRHYIRIDLSKNSLDNQSSVCTEANQTVERPIPKPCTWIQPTDERKAIQN